MAQAQATLGGGCFWCIEAVYEQLQGVTKVVSGYAGGKEPNPTYEAVCRGATGHAEVVQVTFDPARISYSEVLEVFFAVHDPTTPDRQGNDVGPQYRSIILTHGEEQRKEAEAFLEEVAAQDLYDAPVVTEVRPMDHFYEAEAYHQGYFRRNPGQGYCRAIIAPKLAKFRQTFAAKLKA
jgi:peptide-methionine (S)-S-oxide reductase